MDKNFELNLWILAFVLTGAIITFIILRLRKRKRRLPKKVPMHENAPIPTYDTRSGFDEGVIG